MVARAWAKSAYPNPLTAQKGLNYSRSNAHFDKRLPARQGLHFLPSVPTAAAAQDRRAVPRRCLQAASATAAARPNMSRLENSRSSGTFKIGSAAPALNAVDSCAVTLSRR